MYIDQHFVENKPFEHAVNTFNKYFRLMIVHEHFKDNILNV